MDRRPNYYLAFVSYPGGLSSSLNVAPFGRYRQRGKDCAIAVTFFQGVRSTN